MAIKMFRGPMVPKLDSIEVVTTTRPSNRPDNYSPVYQSMLGCQPKTSAYKTSYIERYRLVVLPFNWAILSARLAVIAAVGTAGGMMWSHLKPRRYRVQ